MLVGLKGASMSDAIWQCEEGVLGTLGQLLGVAAMLAEP